MKLVCRRLQIKIGIRLQQFTFRYDTKSKKIIELLPYSINDKIYVTKTATKYDGLLFFLWNAIAVLAEPGDVTIGCFFFTFTITTTPK